MGLGQGHHPGAVPPKQVLGVPQGILAELGGGMSLEGWFLMHLKSHILCENFQSSPITFKPEYNLVQF